MLSTKNKPTTDPGKYFLKYYKMSFFPCTVKKWNFLPKALLAAGSLSAFQAMLTTPAMTTTCLIGMTVLLVKA